MHHIDAGLLLRLPCDIHCLSSKIPSHGEPIRSLPTVVPSCSLYSGLMGKGEGGKGRQHGSGGRGRPPYDVE